MRKPVHPLVAVCSSTGRSTRAIARSMKTFSTSRIRQCTRWRRASPPWHAVGTEAVAGKREQRAAARTTQGQLRYRRCRRTHHPTRRCRNSAFSSDQAGHRAGRSIVGYSRVRYPMMKRWLRGNCECLPSSRGVCPTTHCPQKSRPRGGHRAGHWRCYRESLAPASARANRRTLSSDAQARQYPSKLRGIYHSGPAGYSAASGRGVLIGE